MRLKFQSPPRRSRKTKRLSTLGSCTLVILGICLCLCASTFLFLSKSSPVGSVSILEEQLLKFRALNKTNDDASVSVPTKILEQRKGDAEKIQHAVNEGVNSAVAPSGIGDSFNNNNNGTTTTDNTKDNHDLRLCFITCEFGDSVEKADVLPLVDVTMRRNPPRHFVYTNMPDLPADGWQVLSLSPDLNLENKRMITQSRWGKFLAFQDDRIMEACDIVFYGDAYLLNPIDEAFWQEVGRSIQASPGGLMQNKQPYTHDIPQELRRILQGGKDNRERVEQTRKWFRQQAFYKKWRNSHKAFQVYKNALFGYDPHNVKFQNMVLEFWEIYQQELGSWRDQPYWAYFLALHDIIPLNFPKKLPNTDENNKSNKKDELPFGAMGRKGHGGHVYVDTTNATSTEDHNKK